MALFKHSATFITIIAVLLLCNCSEQLAGAGSETVNGITGCVVNEDGAPVSNSTVKLFPADFNPGSKTVIATRFTTMTDVHGNFTFKKLDPGIYTVIARSQNRAFQARIPDIQVDSSDSVTKLSSCSLAPAGSVVVDFSGVRNFSSGYCYLPGTDIYSPLDSNHLVQLNDIPAGVFESLMYISPADTLPQVLRSAITVHPQESVRVNNPGWKYVRTISFNTTLDGVDITHNLLDIPVLLRLNKDNFNFSQAQSSGTDLLFATSTGKNVQFEIERWDATAQSAEVWLHIDTLQGNSTSQSIAMYWGNETAPQLPVHRQVFDTAAGFQGVWHLCGDTDDSCTDATVNHYYGVSPDSARPASVTGIIGNGRYFDGVRSFITMQGTAKSKINFPQNSQYTISAWVYVENPDNMSHVIVSKGNSQYFLWYTSIHLSSTLWEFSDFRSEVGWDLATAKISGGKWVFIAGVHDGASHVLYVDGERVDTLINNPFDGARSDQSDLMIGRFAQAMASPTNDQGFCYFKGSIDEVQISNVARSSEWIRFSYRNQGTNDKLIRFHTP
jgi:hypothetical protein